jgi:hypothetical protein
MALPLLRRMAKQHKNSRVGRKGILIWIPEAWKTDLYDRADQMEKTAQALFDEIIRDFLYKRP